MKKSCYNVKKGNFDISWPERVARHDLVYLSPPSDPMQYGMPIGNGDIGALVWCDERKIIIAFNKCDLWDDAAFGDFINWEPAQEEITTTLRHACRIVIDFGIPVFDTFYLKDFNARLRLKDGCIEMNLDTPFGKMEAEIFITYQGSILCARIKTDFAEDDGIEITLERYGSRTFAHWYAQIKRDPNLGLHGTETWINDNTLMLSHQLTTGQFICALRPEGEGLKGGRRTSHMASARAEKCPKEITFYALSTSPLDERSDETYAMEVLDHAYERGFDALLADNEACWKAFWDKSFIETDDDYLDNLWHLTMYFSNAGQRGKYPGRFINSLWNWNRDVQPWNFYFHWNQQEAYWGLNAAGHHELCDSYLNYRFNGMEHAKADAERLFGVKDGLFVSDVCERRGYNSALETDNHTPVGEIAMDFWRQYLYTGDKEFLKDKALPYMLGAARFFVSLFVKEKDGKYHAKRGHAYEGWDDVYYDPITELALTEVLFRAVLQALEITGTTDPDREVFAEILENLAPLKMIDTDPRVLKDNGDGTYTIQLGMFKGKTVKSHKELAIGVSLRKYKDDTVEPVDGKYMRIICPVDKDSVEPPTLNGNEIAQDLLHKHGIPTNRIPEIANISDSQPQSNICPVFPMGMIGLKDKGTELYDAAVTSAMTARDCQSMGWDPMPIALARLGLTDAVDEYIYDYPSLWQYYNNGFGHYGPNHVFIADKLSPFRRDLVRDADDKNVSFWAETFPFRHMGLEPLGVFSATMNERLLQSFDGVIRIVPAYGKRNARFKLHAVGGFEVMCEVCEGIPAFVAIRSLRGEGLKLENPWKSAWCNGNEYTGKTIEMDTEQGKTYLFTPDKDMVLEYAEETPSPNMGCKVRPDRRAMLGVDRYF